LSPGLAPYTGAAATSALIRMLRALVNNSCSSARRRCEVQRCCGFPAFASMRPLCVAKHLLDRSPQEPYYNLYSVKIAEAPAIAVPRHQRRARQAGGSGRVLDGNCVRVLLVGCVKQQQEQATRTSNKNDMNQKGRRTCRAR
jgi:hypothetical protein